MSKLAIMGGKPLRTRLFPAYNPIGREEAKAVARVMKTGNLSQYIGAWHPDFMGGPEVRQFESDWAAFFKVKHALAVNSATSGLYLAMGACGIGPGDEVIVSPYTMSASAIAPVIYGAVPVFADIDKNTFCIDPKSVQARITKRTKAIIVVHIFGGPADMNGIMKLARKHRLKVIEDCAQAPSCTYKGQNVGSIGDIGVFSLNYHKHIHTGEGGVVTSNDPELAERIALIRNHAEAVVGDKGREDLAHLLGFNYRMTELSAAIGIQQLKKLTGLVDKRIFNVEYLSRRIGTLPGLELALVESGCRHVYYGHPIKFNSEVVGVHRNTFVNAVKAELPSAKLRENVPLIGYGYVKPLYLQPFYQLRATACSFNCQRYDGKVSYGMGLCPVAERMHFDELVTHEFMRPCMSRKDLDDVVRGFEKVYENLGDLRAYEKKLYPHRKTN
ncbi:MAG: DegT/DnrJ/EryC1/StrS family aminotransferase [Syntrophales bacterium]